MSIEEFQKIGRVLRSKQRVDVKIVDLSSDMHYEIRSQKKDKRLKAPKLTNRDIQTAFDEFEIEE